ncbi:hypothetical protein DRW03_21555 [Corallococcus sp. H22C18031201]|nr:hypothetical protein DRW03_21555 [Corallococcus sp. H22C18031201]
MKTALARTISLSLVLLAGLPAWAQEPTLLHSAPPRAEANQPLRLDGTLVDGGHVLDLFIRYRGPGEPYAQVAMERQYGDLYRGVIPADHLVAPGVEYYVEGVTAGGERVALFQSAARPARVLVGGEPPASRTVTDARPVGRTPPPPVESRPTPPPEEPRRATAPPAASRTRSTATTDDSMAALTADLPAAEPTPAPAPRMPPQAPPPRMPPPAPPPRVASAPREATSQAPAPTEAHPPVARAASPRDPASTRESAAPSSSAHSELEDDLALYSAEDTLALATRHEEKVRTVPAIGSSFGRDQLRALGARTVADVLDVVPGLSVSRDVQGFHRTAIRGLRSDAEVLFLLNGHRLNNFFDGKALMNLPVENLERIEVIRGPGSALYGAGAFLGVVNIVTDRSEGVRMSASGGGFPQDGGGLALTTDGHLSAATTSGELRLYGDADVWHQDGDSKVIEHDSLDDESLTQGLRDVLVPAGHTRDNRFLVNVGGGASYNLGGAGTMGASVRFLTEKRGALLGLFDTVGEDSELRWNVLLADLTWERDLGGNVQLRARAAYDQQSTDRLFQLTPKGFRTGDGGDQLFPSGLREQTRVLVRTLAGTLDADVAVAQGNRLTLGLVAEQQMLARYDYETNYTLDGKLRPAFAVPEGVVDLTQLANGAATRRLTVGLSAQDQWTVIPALTLTFGVRLDATQLPTVDGAGVLNGSKFVPRINPRMGLVFSATDALVLKALYGRAFRAPTPQELVERIPDTTYNQGRFEGDPSLQPATVDTFELGVDLVQTAGDARVRLRGNVFLENFASPIVPVDTTGNIVPLENRELGVRVYGVEGEARLEASRRAAAWINASVSRAQDLELPSQSRLLTDVPQARFNAGVSMPIGDWVNFDVILRSGAERRNNSRSTLELIRRYKIPAYSLITAQLRTEPLMDHWEVALVAQNLFDHDFRDDVPRPDRVTGLLPREGVSGYLTVRARY